MCGCGGETLSRRDRSRKVARYDRSVSADQRLELDARPVVIANPRGIVRILVCLNIQCWNQRPSWMRAERP